MRITAAKEDLLWSMRSCDAEAVRLFSERLSIDPLTAQLLIQRGVSSSSATAFLSPSIDALSDPFLFEEMAQAVSRILRAIDRSEKILIYGDYDVDGVTGTALLVEAFRLLGYPVAYYIPDRFKEGYGLHPAVLKNAREAGTTLVITVDCGTTAHAEIAEAASLGIDILIADHHQLDGDPPRATALLNPSVSQGDPFRFTALSSVGVAFKLAEALYKRSGLSSLRLDSLLDLVALGTLADVAPLTGENRFFVRAGLSVIREGRRPGLSALFHTAGEDLAAATEQTLCYRVIPRLNAAGRLYHAEEAVALLTARSWEEALPLAKRLEQYNQERRRIEIKMWEEADQQARRGEVDRLPVIVLASEGWHPGIVGIIASRLVERYHRPAIVIALAAEGIGRGSGRSIEGINLHQSVLGCRALLEKFGGHAGAVGLTIRAEKVDLFRAALVRELSETTPIRSSETLWIDAEIELEKVNFGLLRALAPLAPFGPAYPEPVFLARNVSLISLRREPDRSVRFKVRNKKGWTLDVIASNRTEVRWEDFSDGAMIDLAFTLEGGRWQGEERIFLKLKGIRSAEVSNLPGGEPC